MGKNIRSSSSPKALAPSIPMPPLADAMDAVRLSVDRFCLLAGVEALAEMMEEDATTVCGARHRAPWEPSRLSLGPATQSEIGYHGGIKREHRGTLAATGSPTMLGKPEVAGYWRAGRIATRPATCCSSGRST